MGFTGIGLDGEYIEKPEDKNDESEDEDEIKESWNWWNLACFYIFNSVCGKNTH